MVYRYERDIELLPQKYVTYLTKGLRNNLGNMLISCFFFFFADKWEDWDHSCVQESSYTGRSERKNHLKAPVKLTATLIVRARK